MNGTKKNLELCYKSSRGVYTKFITNYGLQRNISTMFYNVFPPYVMCKPARLHQLIIPYICLTLEENDVPHTHHHIFTVITVCSNHLGYFLLLFLSLLNLLYGKVNWFEKPTAVA